MTNQYFDRALFLREREMRGFTPELITEIAARNPIVKQLLEHWRMGRMPWEAVLIHMVASLVEQNENLFQIVSKNAATMAPAPVELPPDILAAAAEDALKRYRELAKKQPSREPRVFIRR